MTVIYVITRDLEQLAQLTRAKIATYLGINKSYLSVAFKKGTEMTVSHFIGFEKMKRAEYLLKTRYDLSIKEVSRKVGISDSKQFREKFKATYGLNPGKYRSLFKS